MTVTKRSLAYKKLFDRRLRAAKHRLRCYDFGCEVVGEGNWTQQGRDGGHWRLPVILRSNDGEIDAVFAITFSSNTNHMIEAYAVVSSDIALLIGKWSDDLLRTDVPVR